MTTARALIAAGLVAATALLYAPVTSHEFLNFDDLVVVVGNPNLTVPLTPSTLLSHFSAPSHGNWLPIYSISLHITHALHGANPAAFLLTNVAIHLLAVVLLFAALARMTGAVWPSAFVAGVFALHPLHVESVAWITERKDVLAGLFFMLGLYAYARYVEAPGSRARYAAVVTCFALGIMSKPSVLTFPFVLLLLDHWPLGRLRGSLRQVLAEKIPLIAIMGVAAAATYAAQHASGQTRVGADLPLLARAVNAVESYVYYARDAVWPSGLAPLYPHPFTHSALTTGDLLVALGYACVLLAATAVCVAQRRSHPYRIVGWLWYLGTLVPMIGIVQVGLQARADRYTYIPLVGLSIAVAWSIADLARRSTWARRLALAGGVAALAVLAVVSRFQLAYWHDTITLFERAVAVTARNGFAHEMLGYEFAAKDRNEEAAAHFEEAARVNPGRVQSFFGLAVTKSRLGLTEEAIAAYEAGLRLHPSRVRAHGELGVLLTRAGRHAEAIPHLDQALQALPDEEEFQRARERAAQAIQ